MDVYTPYSQMAANLGRARGQTWNRGVLDKTSGSSKEISETMSVVFLESDIPGSSLKGRNPSELKNDELRFWLKCRDDPAKGLRTKAQHVSVSSI